MKDKKFKVLISWRYIIPILKKYEKIFKKNGIYYETIQANQNIKENQLLRIIDRFDGILCGDDEITKKVINKGKKLKVISKWGTGTDSIDLEFAKKKKIKVYNSPGAFSESVAQLCWGLVLAISRRIFETQKEIKKGYWPKLNGILLKDKYLGVIGLGNVGQRVIQFGRGFGMKVLGNDIKKISSKTLKKFKIKKVSKINLLKKADIIILCVDFNKTSYRLIDYKDFAKMKKNAIIINVSRGPVINEKALIRALTRKQIYGAGLDVFENEPIKLQNKLMKLGNCILSSHNAFNTNEEVEKVHNNTVQNLIAGLKS